ncbi:MAG: MOSC domain-containing protein [Gammaproteobacteria bacterium]|nr:MOSC domain-containing protein [Gammaproteobacteria bacterium]
MELLEETTIAVETGVDGDARGQLRGRQVTVLCQESWDAACRDLGREVPWTTRRANILIEGLDLANSSGKTLAIGGATLAITGETDPCERMDEQAHGLTAALAPDWRGGVTCRVIQAGGVKVGDSVELILSA